jgi:arylsulfatase A-like enzyme
MKRNLPALALAGLLVSSCPAAASTRPNIILAMADDMGWGDPGFNSRRVTDANGTPHPDQGWIHTPVMDAMAANGLRFDRFYAASAVCSPTRASCLTGRNPFRVGVPYANSGRLGFGETPLPEVLAANGYRCAHFGKWHLGTLTTLRTDANRASSGNTSAYSAPWHHGYDFCFATESKVPTYHPYRKPTNGLALPTSFTDTNFYGTRYWRMPATWNQTSGEGIAVPVGEINNPADGDDSRLLARQVIPYLRSAVADDQPFFIVLWFHTPHKPMVDPAGSAALDSSTALRKSIEDMDSALGMIRDELTALGVRGNTMFWMTSDNGPEDGANSPNETNTTRSLSSGRFRERKRSLFEGGVRVPGILEWPDKIPAGRVTAYPAVTSDYYPTILDLLGLTVPDQRPLDGISLRPLIEGTATTRTSPIGFKIESRKSWVNQQYKLIDNGSGWQLYDLVNIPAGEEVEQTAIATASNISTRSPAIQQVYNTMLAEYNAWNTAVTTDAPYVHASRPTVSLQAPTTTGNEPFTVTATFNEPVSRLNPSEFIVTNGTAAGLTGNGAAWTVQITPSGPGQITVSLPEAAATDADGNPNAASNRLVVNATGAATGDIISNGNLNATVSRYGSSQGDTGYYLNPTTLDVFEEPTTGAPVDTGRNAGEWLWSTLTRGFSHHPEGRAPGDGAFVAYTPGDPYNQRPRAVAQFAADYKATRGMQPLKLDVFLDDNTTANPLTLIVQLYAWNIGQAGPKLSLGGGTANVASYNVTNLGNARTVLNAQIPASTVTDAAWQTVTPGPVDLGDGHDFYAWRIGVMGHSPGDAFAFDMVRVGDEQTTYQQWIDGFGLPAGSRSFSDDPDQDGLANGLEAWFGTHPGESNGGLEFVATDSTVASFRHPQNPAPPADVDGSYRWSTNLIDWYAGDGEDGPQDGPFLTIQSTTLSDITTVTLTSEAPLGRAFLRATASLAAAP